jgi:hypothetical protein
MRFRHGVSVPVLLVLERFVVYALYNKRRWTTILLVCVLLAENFILSASMARAIPAIPFQPACLILHMPHSLVYVRSVPCFILVSSTDFGLALQRRHSVYAANHPGTHHCKARVCCSCGMWENTDCVVDASRWNLGVFCYNK